MKELEIEHDQQPRLYAFDFDRGDVPPGRELPQSFAWKAWDLWVRVADWKAGHRVRTIENRRER